MGPWPTIAAFLIERFPKIDRVEWLARIERGEVTDAQGHSVQLDTPYRPNTKIHYYRSLAAEPRIPFEERVLYQDDLIVVADKPHFLPVTPSGRYLQETLLVRLKQRLGIDSLAPVHRIDRETAGLVLFTVQPETRGRYQALFRDRVANKVYEAVAGWRADLAWPMNLRSRLVDGDSFMTVREVPGEANAQTQVELIDRSDAHGLYRLRPLSGKRHQLRVQMAAIGLPLLNDQIYPVLQPDTLQPDYAKPLQLLAHSLAFIDPVSGVARSFESRQRLNWPLQRAQAD